MGSLGAMEKVQMIVTSKKIKHQENLFLKVLKVVQLIKTITRSIYQLMGGVRAGMGYTGSENLKIT